MYRRLPTFLFVVQESRRVVWLLIILFLSWRESELCEVGLFYRDELKCRHSTIISTHILCAWGTNTAHEGHWMHILNWRRHDKYRNGLPTIIMKHFLSVCPGVLRFTFFHIPPELDLPPLPHTHTHLFFPAKASFQTL